MGRALRGEKVWEEGALARFGFGKENRIRKRGEILEVLKSRNRIGASGIQLKWIARKNAHKNTSRLCVVVGKKDVRIAAERNRAKRLVREFFRLHRQELKSFVDVAVLVKSFKLFSYKDIERILTDLLRKAGLICD